MARSNDKRNGLERLIEPVAQQIDERRVRLVQAWSGTGGLRQLLSKTLTPPSRGRFIIDG
jgi:hypothetical protein